MIDWLLASAGLAAIAVALAASRWKLSAAKHPSLAGHPRIARWIVRRVPRLRYGRDAALGCDDADDAIVARRREGLQRLEAAFSTKYARTIELTRSGRDVLPDLRFTSAYRMPMPFASLAEGPLGAGSFAVATDGVRI